MTFLILVQNTIQASSAGENLPPLTVELGQQHKIQSKALAQEKILFVRLPNGYTKSDKAYPVVYVLDTNFIIGNIYQETVSLVSRLEAMKDIPEVIIVGIQSNQWYKNVITESDTFEHFVSWEVPSFIDSKYRTSPNSVLVGHSYAGAFVSGALPITQRSFDLFLSISPIFPNLAFIDKVQQRYNQLPALSARLHIIDGDESPTDKLILEKTASKLAEDKLSLTYDTLPLESHFSVFTTGLSIGLRTYFSDFRKPSRAALKSKDFDLVELKKYFAARDQKYGTDSNEEFIKKASTSMAHKYTSMKRFDLAIPYWRNAKSKFKEYFMAEHADRFVKNDDLQSAIILWKEMIKLFPNSKTDYASLIEKNQTTKR